MVRRIAIAALWFLAVWSAASMVSLALALPTSLVPAAAVVAGVVMFSVTRPKRAGAPSDSGGEPVVLGADA